MSRLKIKRRNRALELAAAQANQNEADEVEETVGTEEVSGEDTIQEVEEETGEEETTQEVEEETGEEDNTSESKRKTKRK